MSIENIFISRIKILLKESSPTAFGKKCGIDAKTVRSALEGKIPGQPILAKISKATGMSVEWILGLEKEEFNQQHLQTVSEPPPMKSIQKYEQIMWKFQHLFDFLIESYGENSIAINDFLSKMERDFLINDPDYRLWTYRKREQAAELQKKRADESGEFKPMGIKSVNSKK